jgi:hypothetical protein
MSTETSGTTTPTGASPQKQALLEAFDSVLKKQAEEREAERRAAEARQRARAGIRTSILLPAVFALFLCAYLYIEHPAWLFPSATHPESVAVKEASLRITMANAAQHVERFRQQNGRPPATLSAAGTEAPWIVYQAVDSTDWRMVGTNGEIELTLTSGDPLPKFLGNSFELIARRVQ